MPYPRAYLVLLALILLTVLAFWPGYFSQLGSTSFLVHVHGVSATLWLLMLTTQSWLAHHRQLGVHRLIGRISPAVVTVFVIGGLTMLKAMSIRTHSPEPNLMHVYGSGLALLDVIAVTGFVWLYHGALRHRRQVQLHARFMLATIILLLAPILTRLLVMHFPPLMVRGPEDFALFGMAVQVSNFLALGVAVSLYLSAPRWGRPFVVVAALVILQAIAFQWLTELPPWRGLFAALATTPTLILVAIGLVVGTLITISGLRERPAKPVPAS